jgi:hypothetical protein
MYPHFALLRDGHWSILQEGIHAARQSSAPHFGKEEHVTEGSNSLTRKWRWRLYGGFCENAKVIVNIKENRWASGFSLTSLCIMEIKCGASQILIDYYEHGLCLFWARLSQMILQSTDSLIKLE